MIKDRRPIFTASPILGSLIEKIGWILRLVQSDLPQSKAYFIMVEGDISS